MTEDNLIEDRLNRAHQMFLDGYYSTTIKVLDSILNYAREYLIEDNRQTEIFFSTLTMNKATTYSQLSNYDEVIKLLTPVLERDFFINKEAQYKFQLYTLLVEAYGEQDRIFHMNHYAYSALDLLTDDMLKEENFDRVFSLMLTYLERNELWDEFLFICSRITFVALQNGFSSLYKLGREKMPFALRQNGHIKEADEEEENKSLTFWKLFEKQENVAD